MPALPVQRPPEPDGRGELRVKPEAAAAAGAAASLSLTQESRVLPASTQLGQASQLASEEDKTSAPSASEPPLELTF